MIPTFLANLNRGGQWLVQQLSPVGLWLIVFGLVANLIANSVTVQTCRDVIRNEKETASMTNGFLRALAQGEENRLSGDSAFVDEFRKTIRERDEKLERIYGILSRRDGTPAAGTP